jgi:hypothetical protein
LRKLAKLSLLSKRSSAILQILGVAAIALVLGLALGASIFSVTRTTTQVSTVEIQQQESNTMYYDASTVTMPVTGGNIPESFVVGNYAFNETEYAPLPPITTNGVEKVFMAGVLLIFNVSLAYSNHSPYEEANFTWPGTFSESDPTPSNATLFSGEVRLSWFVSDQLLYLIVATDS